MAADRQAIAGPVLLAALRREYSNRGLSFAQACTEGEKEKMVGMRLAEISSCYCVTVLSGSAWVLLNKIYPFFSQLCIADI